MQTEAEQHARVHAIAATAADLLDQVVRVRWEQGGGVTRPARILVDHAATQAQEAELALLFMRRNPATAAYMLMAARCTLQAAADTEINRPAAGEGAFDWLGRFRPRFVEIYEEQLRAIGAQCAPSRGAAGGGG